MQHVPTYKRSAVSLISAALLTLSVATAASASPAPAPRSSASRNGPSGTLTVAVNTAVTTLSPQPFGSADGYFERALYQPLVDIHGTQDVPVLASSWHFGPDHHFLVLNLRKNVKFSDGSAFNATAAAWNINWVKSPATGAQAVALWAAVTPKVLGPYTLQLTFSKPVPEIFGMLSAALIVKPNGENKGIGTGPFKVSSFVPGTSLSVIRNPYYWVPGQPKLQRITFKNYPDLPSAALALQSHGVDVLYGAEDTQVKPLEADGFKLLTIPGGGADDILVNTTAGPLRNAKVREALSLAFNRDEFVKIATDGYEQPRYSIFPSSSPVFSPKYDTGSYNLSRAKSLLHQAGVSKLTLTIETASNLPQTIFLPIYKQNLAQIGVTLNIDEVDTATWLQAAATGNFKQLLAHIYNFGNSDPALLFSAYPFKPTNNAEHYVSPTYQRLVEEAGSAAKWSTRVALYHQIDRFIQQQAFVIPLANDPNPVLYDSSVKGLSIADGIVLDFGNASIA